MLHGLIGSLKPGRRQAVCDDAFEQFAMIQKIRSGVADAAVELKIRSILLIDVGKNLLPFWLAARDLGLEIVAIADANLARPGRRYRGIPVVDDDAARSLNFDAAVVTNISPVHGPKRAEGMALHRQPARRGTV